MTAVANRSSDRNIAFAVRTTFLPLSNCVRFLGLGFRVLYQLIVTWDCTLGMDAIARIRRRPTDRAHGAYRSLELGFGVVHL